MDFLRRFGGEAFNQLWLWALGSILFTVIMAGMGWNRTFAEKPNSHDRHGARPEAGSHLGKKPVTPADWPSATADSGLIRRGETGPRH